MARPSDYSLELAKEICCRLVEGESLKAICASDEMPSRSTVFRWLTEKPEFQDMYTRAREEQAETLADELAYIADTAEDVQKARLQVDVRKWAAAKLKPRKYGDRATLEHTGEGGGPINATLKVEFLSPDGD
jgi:hypothetical protein